jgi:hypothetical protein
MLTVQCVLTDTDMRMRIYNNKSMPWLRRVQQDLSAEPT